MSDLAIYAAPLKNAADFGVVAHCTVDIAQTREFEIVLLDKVESVADNGSFNLSI